MLEKIALQEIVTLAQKAGEAVMEIYNKDFAVEYKQDSSPLTEADTKANEIICSYLQKHYKEIPIISEENRQIGYDIRKEWEYLWCIDPIDGTKEFVKKNGEFTINIALIHKDTPVLGVVYAPALGVIYAAKKGEGATKNGAKLPLVVHENKKQKLRVVASKSHLTQQTQEYIESLDAKEIEQVSIGSSLKLCMIAEGVADLYPRLAPTMEWDTAAADAVVREVGKMSCVFGTSKPLCYNKEDLHNPFFEVK